MQNLVAENKTSFSGFDVSSISSFDAEKDPSVTLAKQKLANAEADLTKARKDLAYQENTEPSQIQEAYNQCLAANVGYPDLQNTCIARWVTPRWAARENNIATIKEKISLLEKNTIPEAIKAYQDAVKVATETNNKKIDGEVKRLEAQALTDPTAAAQITKLNEQKLANELVIKQAETKAKASSKWMWVGIVVVVLIVIAGLWVLLTKQKVIPSVA